MIIVSTTDKTIEAIKIHMEFDRKYHALDASPRLQSGWSLSLVNSIDVYNGSNQKWYFFRFSRS